MLKLLFSLMTLSNILGHQSELPRLTPITSISALGAKDIQLTNNPLTEYPDICIDQNGDVWIAYVELNGSDQESIVLKRVRGFAVLDSFQVSKEAGLEYFPRLVCDAKNRISVTWAAKRGSNWDIYLRSIENGQWSEELRVTNDPEVDIHPAIAVDKDNVLWIVWETLRNHNFDIYAVRVQEGRIGQPTAISTSAFMDLRPAVLTDGNTLFIAWDRHVDDSYRILLRKFNGKNWENELTVSPERGFNMSPAIAVTRDGALVVAWHSTLRLDGAIGITPWIYMKRFPKSGKADLFAFASEEDQFKTGEDQGLEFPTLLVDKVNRLWVFSRPSQGFVAQCIDGMKKSQLYRFDVKGWGGRGQHVRAALAADGSIYTVRRDIQFIYMNRIEAKTAAVECNDPLWSAHEDLWEQASYAYATPPKRQALRLPDNYQILFGDIHQHSSISDGMGTVDQCYVRSRHIYKHDFAALSDHEWFVGNLITPSEWEWIKIVGRQFDKEPDFITFAAYEWTTPRTPVGFGHKNVYFADWDQKIFSFKKGASHTKDLFQLVKEHNAIAIPHHIGWTGTDWENHDEQAQPVIEMISAHGAYEYMGNEPIAHRGGMTGNFIQDGLAQGLKFGMLGSSDGHGLQWHGGIARKEDVWQTGLTGAVVRERSKRAIMEALKQKRVYATSGAAIQLEFRINNRWMGEVIQSDKPPEIFINVEGTARLHYVTLLRNNQPIVTFGRDIAEGHGVRMNYVDTTVIPGKHWYYLRVLQENGEMAWSSPIWVEIK